LASFAPLREFILSHAKAQSPQSSMSAIGMWWWLCRAGFVVTCVVKELCRATILA
jgi:hypothetical protein